MPGLAPECSRVSASLAGSQDSPRRWPVQGAQQGAGRLQGISACVSLPHRSLHGPGPAAHSPDPRAWGQLEGRPGAWEGYLLRLSGPVEKTLSLGPGALNVTFPGPLPSGHYVLELRVLAGPYEAQTQAAAWLGGESGLVANGLGSCPGAPTLRGVDSHPPGPTPSRCCSPAPAGQQYRAAPGWARGQQGAWEPNTALLRGGPLPPQKCLRATWCHPGHAPRAWGPLPGGRCLCSGHCHRKPHRPRR